MNIFIISLSENNDTRRIHIKNEFNNKNLKFSFFDAITVANINTKISIFNEYINKMELYPPEIACFLSHISLWNKMVAENIGVAAIFEDDIYLSRDSYQFLENSNWIPEDIHIIKIEKFFNRVLLDNNNKIKINKTFSLYRLLEPNHGSAGYIITLEGVKYILNKLKNKTILDAIDEELFNHLLINNDYHIYQMNPTLCIQDMVLNHRNCHFQSSINDQRTLRFIQKFGLPNKKNSSIILNKKQKIIRELIRPFKQLKKKLSMIIKRHKIPKNYFKKTKIKFNS